MALSKPLTEELKEDLHCSICIERYESPRMLPCVHSFCLKCLEKCESNLKPGKAFTCPTCRGVVKLPEQGVKGLPSNFFIVNLMEKLDLAEEFSGKATSKCSFCSESNGQIYCLDCKLLLCTSCRSVHSRISGTQEHIIADVGRLSDPQYVKQLTSGQAPRCKTHPSEKLRFFCSNCKSLVCRDCMLLSHQGHQCIEAKSRAQSARAALQHSLSQVHTLKKQEQQKELANSKKDLHSQSVHARREIENHFSNTVARLQSDKQKLLADVDRIEEQEWKGLADEEAKVSSWIEAAQNTKRMTERIIEENNEWQIISMEQDLIGAIENLGQRSTSSNYWGKFVQPSGLLTKRMALQTRPNFKKSDLGGFYEKNISQSQPPGYCNNPGFGETSRRGTYYNVENLLGKVSSEVAHPGAPVAQLQQGAINRGSFLSFRFPSPMGHVTPLSMQVPEECDEFW